jgi:hypothetical protein
MTNASDPMFPTIQPTNSNSFETVLGLTIREHFAAMAMQGILTSDNFSIGDSIEQRQIFRAKSAVEHADALIKALNQTT